MLAGVAVPIMTEQGLPREERAAGATVPRVQPTLPEVILKMELTVWVVVVVEQTDIMIQMLGRMAVKADPALSLSDTKSNPPQNPQTTGS
jgi:hypothetical protein